MKVSISDLLEILLRIQTALLPSMCCSSFCVRAAPVKQLFLFSLSDRLHSAVVSNDNICLS